MKPSTEFVINVLNIPNLEDKAKIFLQIFEIENLSVAIIN